MTKHDRYGYEVPTRVSQAELRGAVRLVLDHYLQDELADWKQSSREQRQEHIYGSLRTLRNWMREQDELLRNRGKK